MASIRRRKDRKSGWIVDCRDVPGGRRLTVSTREQAEALRAEMVKQGQQAMPSTQDRDITLDAYADRWLEQITSSVEPRTLASYRENLRLHIRPIFGDVKVRGLHRGHIKALLAKKRTEGLSKNSVRLIRATLSVMLGDALDDGILQTNPALGIGRRGRKSPDSISHADRQKKIKVMTYEQLATFSAVSSAKCSRRNALFFLLMADAGLRPGEACGIQWPDFDPVGRTLHVERSVEDSGRVKTLKTDKSRSVDLSPRLVSALLRLQASLEADAMLAGEDGISTWVFITRAGTPPRPHRIAKTFKKVLRAAGLPPDFTLYCLRHTYVSHLIATGAPITYIAAQVGHSKVTTTLTYYAHLFPNGDRRHVEQMERVRSTASPLAAPSVPRDDVGLPLNDDDEGLNEGSWHHFGPRSKSATSAVSEVADSFGGPSRTRTVDPLIKSQLLYQLS